MPPRNGRIELPPRRTAFFGITHQWAAGEATGAVGSGKVGVQDSVVLDTGYDVIVHGRAAIWDTPTGGQDKIMFLVNRQLMFQPGAPSGAVAPGVGGGSVYLSTLGKGQYPQWFRAPKLIRGGSTFTGVIDDRQTVAGAVQVRTLHFGAADLRRTWAPRRWYAEQDHWQSLADFTAEGPNGQAIPANTTRSLPIVVDPEIDVEITKVVIVSDGEAKIQVKNIGLRTEWFNKAVHVWLLAGTGIDADPPAGAWPFLLPQSTPEFLFHGGGLLTTIQDLSGLTNRVQVLYLGRSFTPAGGLAIDEAMAAEGRP